MKARLIGIFVFPVLYLCTWSLACQSHTTGAPDRQMPAPKTDKQRAAYDSLHFRLVEHYSELSAAEREHLRKTLKKRAVWPFEIMCPDSEPGMPLLLNGRLTDQKGYPVNGARVHIFQTNHEGYYAPSDAQTGQMQEQDARLDGHLTTDSTGAFRICTVHPASYPKKYQGRLIPAHVHLNISADGFHDLFVQVTFDDDPAMTDEHWIKWAESNQFPIVHVWPGSPATGEIMLQINTLHK